MVESLTDLQIKNNPELNKLFYGLGILEDIEHLIQVKDMNATLHTKRCEMRHFNSGNGLIITLSVLCLDSKWCTIEYRLFPDSLIQKVVSTAVDKKANLDIKKLPLLDLVKLRILYIIYDYYKQAVDPNRPTPIYSQGPGPRAATVWISGPNGATSYHQGITTKK